MDPRVGDEDIMYVKSSLIDEAFLMAFGNKLIDFRRRGGNTNDDGESSSRPHT
jgi:hypothetical protein